MHFNRYPSPSLRLVYDAINSMRLKCPACGKSPRIGGFETSDDDEFALYAECHGSHDVFRMPRQLIYSDKWRGLLSNWFAGLFKIDCNPDVMELPRYNRGNGLTGADIRDGVDILSDTQWSGRYPSSP